MVKRYMLSSSLMYGISTFQAELFSLENPVIHQFLQDQDIQRFYNNLSSTEMVDFRELVEIIMSHEKTHPQSNTILNQQEEYEIHLDQGVENDFCEFSFRYQSLLQKMYDDPTIASKLMACCNNCK